MHVINDLIFGANFFTGLYILYLTLQLSINWIIIMRVIATIWVMFICGSYPLLNIAWNAEESIGNIIVPKDLDLSFHYWELSVGLSITFVFILMYLSIKSGYYGRYGDS